MSHYSLEVRTLASHAEDPGSIPGGGATKKTYAVAYVFFVSTTPGMKCGSCIALIPNNLTMNIKAIIIVPLVAAR